MSEALTTLWIANTGSLLLPVSNLTNLLAVHRFEDLGAGHGDYVRTAALPAVTAIVVTLLLVAVLQRRALRGTYAVEPLDLLHLSATSAVGANVVNNLPAYLLVEPAAADDVRRLVATLVGVNAGALVAPRASLATLLWLQRCRSAGVRVPLLELASWGALCATLCVTAATLTIR